MSFWGPSDFGVLGVLRYRGPRVLSYWGSKYFQYTLHEFPTKTIGTVTIKGATVGFILQVYRARSARLAKIAKGVQGACPLAGSGGAEPLHLSERAGLEGRALHLSERAGARGGAPAVLYNITARCLSVGSSIGI